jgi:RNA polymerase sigma-70 factor, ECF subfamily
MKPGTAPMPTNQPAVSDSATMPADDMLVVAARRGNIRAFEQLYRLHVGKVFGLCLRLTGQREVAEDCAQLTFVQAWRGLAGFAGRSAFSSWLHRIAVNQVMTYRRNSKPSLPADDAQVVQDLHDAAEQTQTFQTERYAVDELLDVEQALRKLPNGARDVIVLQTVYGYSHEEVADMLGIAVGTCKAQLHRGRRLLREQLGWPESAAE